MALAAGGVGINGVLVSAELYHLASESWTATGSLNNARDRHTATLLPNGMVLVLTGGWLHQASQQRRIAPKTNRRRRLHQRLPPRQESHPDHVPLRILRPTPPRSVIDSRFQMMFDPWS